MARLARRARSGWFAILTAIAACVAFTAPPNALGQSGTAGTKPASAQQSNVPTIKVTSRETVVDVTVTDAKGNPVHGLTQADFTVKEDRKEQPIRSFHEYDSDAVPAPEKLPPNTYSNRQPAAASSAVNILLLDFTNAAPGATITCCINRLDPSKSDLTIGPKSLFRAMERQRHVKQYAMQYLHDMPVGTRVAAFGASWPSNLRVLQGVTSDPALLSAAVDSMEYDTDAFAYNGETWCDQQVQRNRMTIESLQQIAADLAVIKGRKNLLWFTSGTMGSPSGRTPCLDDSPGLKKAFGLLTAAQVTVYPIWVRGVPAGEVDPWGEFHEAELLAMESVAEATGGTAYYNSNDLKASIGKAIASGSDYYTLTYVPPGTQYDGRHHTIKLDVDRPGLHLTYRDEYYAEDPSKMKPAVGLTLSTTAPEVADGNMRAAMSRSMPTSEQILFNVKVEPSTTPAKPGDPPVMGTLDARFKDKPLIRYTFSYSISAGQLAYSNGPNGTHNGSVELDLAAYDADAKLVTGLSQTITMSLNDTTVANKQPLNFSQQLDLPPGQLFVRIGVLDHTSNKVGTLEIPFTVGKKSPTPAIAASGTESK